MTDKVQKIREVIEKRYECWKEKELNSHSIESEIRMSECQHLLLMLDSLQKEPVSEDLEEAANNYGLNVRKGYPRVKDETDKYICNAFKTGAKWDKEQMMAKAIDAKLLEGHLIRQKGVTHPLHVGDKVKVIIIKED